MKVKVKIQWEYNLNISSWLAGFLGCPWKLSAAGCSTTAFCHLKSPCVPALLWQHMTVLVLNFQTYLKVKPVQKCQNSVSKHFHSLAPPFYRNPPEGDSLLNLYWSYIVLKKEASSQGLTDVPTQRAVDSHWLAGLTSDNVSHWAGFLLCIIIWHGLARAFV